MKKLTEAVDWITRLVASLLPTRLRYWVFMQVMADTTEGVNLDIEKPGIEFLRRYAPRPYDL